MAGDISTSRHVIIVGANHRSSSLALRDRLFVEDPAVGLFFDRLRAQGVDEAMVLSTCDRVEVQAAHANRDAAGRAITTALAEQAGMDPAELAGALYTHWDADAVRHIFTVTASLDSQVVGEPQVLGQVKAGHRMARAADMIGPTLEPLYQAAYGAAKRVRTQTAIGERPVSIAAAAVQLARDLHGDLARCSGLLIGAGEMGELVAGEMLAGGMSSFTVIHPTEARAQAAARAMDCHFAPYDDMARLLAEADVTVAALGRHLHVLTSDMVMGALKGRRRKPVFLIDTGIPGDIEPAVNRLDGAFLYDLNDLEQVALEGLANRETEAREAWRIVDADVAAYLHGRAERAAVPALMSLRDHFEDMRAKTLEEAPDSAERATRLLINRLLHGPSRAMREIASQKSALELEDAERALNQLFDLGEETKG
ncbi:MAG: glutamyl-tRNA reductase [Rhodospirillales bacterium]|nr:glutamyl-tRNA reductase [Rhodospirillales bacterium]